MQPKIYYPYGWINKLLLKGIKYYEVKVKFEYNKFMMAVDWLWKEVTEIYSVYIGQLLINAILQFLTGWYFSWRLSSSNSKYCCSVQILPKDGKGKIMRLKCWLCWGRKTITIFINAELSKPEPSFCIISYLTSGLLTFMNNKHFIYYK